MNKIYYYTNINYIPPGIVAQCGIFSCADDNRDLIAMRDSGKFDIIVIGESTVVSDWSDTGSGYQRNPDPNKVINKEPVKGIMGIVGEDDIVLASRLWISHSTNHKRMSSDMMHNLLFMRVCISEEVTDQILLGPCFSWMTPAEHDRFLVQIEVTKPEWDRLYRSITDTMDFEYVVTRKVDNHLSPITVLGWVTDGPDQYFDIINQIIKQYQSAGNAVSYAIVDKWSPFPLPDYETLSFRRFMADWMLKNVHMDARYLTDLEYHVNRVVTHACDTYSGGA